MVLLNCVFSRALHLRPASAQAGIVKFARALPFNVGVATDAHNFYRGLIRKRTVISVLAVGMALWVWHGQRPARTNFTP